MRTRPSRSVLCLAWLALGATPARAADVRSVPPLLGELGANAFGVSAAAILGTDQVLSYRVRWSAQEGGVPPYEARAGVRIGGVEYLGPARELPATVGTFEETFAFDPSDGGAWTKERIARSELFWRLTLTGFGLPRPFLTQLVGLASVIEGPERPEAVPSSTAAHGSPASTAPSARASSPAPAAGVSGQAPEASVQSVAPAATPAGTTPSARASGTAPRAVTAEDLDTVQVRVSSGAPRATVSSSAPKATTTASPAKSEVS